MATGLLLDHLVGTSEQRRRYSEAERFRSFEVNHQINLDRLLNRKSAWFCATQYFVDVLQRKCGASVIILAIGEEKAIPCPLISSANGGDHIAQREFADARHVCWLIA